MRHLAIAAIAALLAACGAQENAAPATPTEAIGGEIVTSGEFSGLSDHVTTGRVTIRKDNDVHYVVLEKDFSLDGAPDPTLGFGNGEYLIETQFSALKNKDGYQTYPLPSELDPTQFTQIYVWCEEFSVPLGVATINQ